MTIATNLNKRHARKKSLGFMVLLGLILIIMSLILLFVNPVLTLINFKLRLANGTLLHKLMMQGIEGPKICMYLYNITNADRFQSGDDVALKVEEVGPFVYQEYQTFEDLEYNTEASTMQFTPKHRTELILEESLGRPEDFLLVLPNIALLSAVHIVSKYPYFIGQIFKILISGMNLKAFTRISAYKYMWNNTDPLIGLINSVVPGLIYYNSTGLLSRFFDEDAKYRMTLDISDLNKFQLKRVERFPIDNTMKSATMLEKTQYYQNTYEGALYPSRMTPEMPINIYRYSVCKTVEMSYNGTKQMWYGSEASLYKIGNTVLNERKLCDTKKWCPYGIMDLSTCYNGFPLAISKAHFLDADAKLHEKIEGLKPNRSLHDSILIVDPTIGLAIEAFVPVQLSLALGDMSLLKETRKMTDIFLPLSQTVIINPRMQDDAKSILRLMYSTGHYIVISCQVLCALLGVWLLAFSVRRICWHEPENQQHTVRSNTCSVLSKAPLLQKKTF